MPEYAELEPEALTDIPDLVRCEEFDREALGERITEMTHTVYRHEQVYGQFITIHSYIDCHPDDVFAYMADPYCLIEWTYSVRELRPSGMPGVLRGVDAQRTPFFCRTVTDERARTVDYHCAWDQGTDLWMVYLNRIVPAETVLKRPGSVVIWTNCRHPYYEANPFPHLCADPKREWVGEWWPLFFAGHSIELANLKNILEHRYRRGLPVGPHIRGVRP